MRVTNQEAKVKTLHKGTLIAECRELTEADLEKKRPPTGQRTKRVPFGEGEIEVGAELTDEQVAQLLEVLQKYEMCFAFDNLKLGKCTVGEFTIDTTDDKPVRSAPYRYSQPMRDTINKQVDDLLKAGVIEPSNSDYGAPVVLVKKADGDWRMCVDLRQLNKKIKDDNYPMANIQDNLHALNGAKYFCVLDLNSGYFQIVIRKGDRYKTAFVTQDGLFHFKYMPFGIKSAPAFFQRNMDKVLGGLKWSKVVCYLDDVTPFGRTFEELLSNLDETLKAFQRANLTIKPSKCAFATQSISFLGHIVDSEGIKMDPEKIRAIIDFPEPRNVRDIQAFLGKVGYYRNFIEGLQVKLEPMTRLLRKNQTFDFGKEQRKSFQQVKSDLVGDKVLMHFDPELEKELRTDACGYGIGGVFGHRTDQGFRPVIYWSRLLSDSERKLANPDKECLSLVGFVTKHRPFCFGYKVYVKTDHCSLCYLYTNKDLSPKCMRWAMILQGYDLVIEYKSAKHHKDADCLSRYPVSALEHIDDNLSDYIMCINSNSADSDIRHEQREYPFIKPIIDLLETERSLTKRETEELSKYTLVKEVLYKRSPDSNPRLLLCVPDSLRDDILFACHDDPMGGHFGYRRTLQKAKERFTFRYMSKYCKHYVDSCMECQTKKQLPVHTAGMLSPITVGDAWYMIAIDINGPFPMSESGNKYVIVVTDYLTKCVECKAVPKATAWEVAKMIVEMVLCRHGCPQKILSDRGLQFLSKVAKNIYDLMNTAHVKTTSYHPQTNGLVERFNRTLNIMLSMFVSKDQRDWDRALAMVVFAYMTSVQESTGYTPFYLLYGREARLPVENVLQTPSRGIADADEYVTSAIDALKIARECATESIKNNQEKYTERANKTRRNVTYNEGDLVLIYFPTRIKGKAEKLLHPYHGPYRIIRRMSSVVYEVVAVNGKRKPDFVHVSRLKAYKERAEGLEGEGNSSVTQPAQTASQQPELSPVAVQGSESGSDTELYEPPEFAEDESETDIYEYIPLRRSNRTRKAPNKLTYGLFSLLALFAFFIQ
ncbi:Pol polyprotein-like protein, partial [Leptotrombidium deliense]